MMHNFYPTLAWDILNPSKPWDKRMNNLQDFFQQYANIQSPFVGHTYHWPSKGKNHQLNAILNQMYVSRNVEIYQILGYPNAPCR